MAKGDDAIRKKKNKLNRKKMRNDSSAVSARIAAIIASKQRRKSGKRRMCEGMCFGLPTPEDPFNDRHGNKSLGKKKAKKLSTPQADAEMSHTEKGANWKKGQRNQTVSDQSGKTQVELRGNGEVAHAQQRGPYENSDCPSKFLILCLNAIQNALSHDGTFNADMVKPLLVNMWGVEFWKCYSLGFDILETTGAFSTIEQIAWMVSTAADTIARKEKEGLSVASPFLLFLVSSQEKAIKARSICKPLKHLGIHTVSLHPGTSLDHQIQGLKSCDPEFLVSTPERLLELVSLRAIDISRVSLLVVDGLETFIRDDLLDKIKFIRQSISGNPQTLVFSDCSGHVSTSVVQNLLLRSIYRLSLSDSILSQSACIVQSVHVAALEEKLSKGVQLLDQACSNQVCSQLHKVLFIVGTDGRAQTLCTTLTAKGYSISNNSISNNSQETSSGRVAVSVTDKEHIGRTNIEEFEVVIIVDFLQSIDDYIGILTRMARHIINGALHSCFCREDAQMAGQLIEILEQCGQTVPESLRNLCDSLSNLEH